MIPFHTLVERSRQLEDNIRLLNTDHLRFGEIAKGSNKVQSLQEELATVQRQIRERIAVHL